MNRLPRSRRVTLAVISLLTVAVGLLLAHEGHTPLPSRGARVDVATGLVTLSGDARTTLDVQTTEIVSSTTGDSILAPASLVAPWKGHAFAVSRLPGRIVALRARPGDRVEAGQVLAEVQSQDLELLRLEIQTARNEVRYADQVAQGVRETGGNIPEREILGAELQLQQARNTLELARIKWLALGLPEERLEALLQGDTRTATPTLAIRSPVAGTVIHADLANGKMIEPGEHLFEIVDLSTVQARVGVLEKDIPRITAGLPVELRLTAYPGEVFRGTITLVGQYLDPETHLNDVWVEYQNPAGVEPRLLPGMYGQARIEFPPSRDTWTVPTTALINDGVDRFVLVEEARATNLSEYRKKSVVVVRETPDHVEIRSPELVPGDRVVTQGSHELGTFFAPGVLRISPETAQTIGLRVAPVGRQVVNHVEEISGVVELPPDRRSVATARLPGTVLSIQAERGQQVTPGQVLAEVFSLDLLNVQLDLLREHLATELAEQTIARLRSARTVLPRRRLIEAEAERVSVSTRRDSLRRRLELLGITPEQVESLVKNRKVIPSLPVRATVAGIVVAFDRVVGQAVRAEESLFEIHDLTRPWVQGLVSEQNLRKIQVGQQARVRLVSDPDRVIPGKVVRSGQTFGATHRTLSVWVELDNAPPVPLRNNLMARLTLVVEHASPTLAVPVEAIFHEGSQAFVFVQHDDTFERRAVILGRGDDHHAEVRSGLVEGERIAVTAAQELHTAWAAVR